MSKLRQSLLAPLVIAASAATLVAARPAVARHADPAVEIATFAGGCFWSMERPFDHTPGVISTTVGYTGGHTQNPTYDDVSSRTTGHAESVQVRYDPSKTSYDKLLYVYWHNIDPVSRDRQFCDQGTEYRPAIFYNNEAQHQAAEKSKQELTKSGLFDKPIVTEVLPATTFFKAEEYHQHFADKNPDRYNAYRRGCGRDERLKEIWGSSAEPNVPPLP